MTSTLRPDGALAIAVVDAMRSGDVDALTRLLADNPGLAAARRSGADALIAWLHHRGARSARDVPPAGTEGSPPADPSDSAGGTFDDQGPDAR